MRVLTPALLTSARMTFCTQLEDCCGAVDDIGVTGYLYYHKIEYSIFGGRTRFLRNGAIWHLN